MTRALVSHCCWENCDARAVRGSYCAEHAVMVYQDRTRRSLSIVHWRRPDKVVKKMGVFRMKKLNPD